MSIRRKPQEVALGRLDQVQQVARTGADRARQGASVAADRLAPAAQQSREMAAERVLVLREWSAPRLMQAARYVETELSPRVSLFLTDMAHRVEPPQPQRRRRNTLMAMTGAIAALGAAGVVMTRQRVMNENDGDGTDDAMTVSGTDEVRSPH
ncbi:hypothetical protein [Spirillospora albida]|uniref:hypothetical protein n=1 Tax=Spirillospora albida TaxID=58123 RepID=UPI00055B139B|nr:hypothetical protein [Spirillospora albida]